jgi:hypothetical protein
MKRPAYSLAELRRLPTLGPHLIARLCHVAARTVTVRWIDSGLLPARRDPVKGRRVRREDLAAFFARHSMPDYLGEGA